VPRRAVVEWQLKEITMVDEWLKPPAQRKHPHADAVYRIIETPDRAYGVEVAIPDSSPAFVTSFATEDAAEAWITKHKRQVESGPLVPKRTKPTKIPAS
jgi:hypothetical protein